ncbi:GNAT family N-acetyltransferase [Staphylococcus devriesei]|uniref:GNAT family N-acetyltransferase n=1 Tax=Staphylococcus devriesei TaxID=586733 RepID=A0A2T4KKX3_9STAP|nr:GNAT family N-acetyltransferase [Staphylococcus devriesei]MCE5090997.1 GNAT family N-acetyltransferase [Staphylococcus devriesei]PTF00965.1 GNAT family N-acetyltransferase [Staphylococcus devriesei]PTF14840.1 GNAT family N-acetyltransferase [Staphylococcus devriesei]
MSVYTRLFNEGDFEKLDELSELFKDLGYPPNRNELIERLTEIHNHKDYYLLLLIKDNKIIGLSGMCKMLFYERNGKYMRVLAFVINSNYRGLGFGNKLLRESENFSKQLNCKVITLNSGDRKERLAAHNLYNNSGYYSTTVGFTKNL